MASKNWLGKLMARRAAASAGEGGPAPSTKAGRRDEGDRLRDLGKSAEAAEAYGDYLTERPDDFDIWVQRGNCLKDSGSYDSAELAYSKAIEINPSDGDVHLQMARLAKLQRNYQKASEIYARALALDGNLRYAAEEFSEKITYQVNQASSPGQQALTNNKPELDEIHLSEVGAVRLDREGQRLGAEAIRPAWIAPDTVSFTAHRSREDTAKDESLAQLLRQTRNRLRQDTLAYEPHRR